MFPSVNVINVPAVLDKNGHLRCTTTSTYRAECPTPVQPTANATITKVDNHTNSTGPSTALQITGINSNAESYFLTGQNPGYAVMSSKFDMVQVSFSIPFVYAPLSDQFPSKIVNENFGYVPQTLIEWIVRHPDYVSKFSGIASCLPGGPSIDFDAGDVCSRPPEPVHDAKFIAINLPVQALTISSTVTIAGRGCFHPGACPTSAAPGATAAATTPLVTPEALSQNGKFVLCCSHKSLTCH